MTDEDDRGNVTHHLGDPQAHIGRTGNDGRLRLCRQDGGEIIEITGHNQPVLAFTHFHPNAIAHGRQLFENMGALSSKRVFHDRTVVGNDAGSAHDRLIARAAAKITL